MRNLFVTLSLILASLSVGAQTSYSRYDVNNDHEVNVTDVTMLVNIILGSDKSNRGDVNGDEAVNVTDVTTLVDFILGKRTINGHEFVDLGLPSGTLWSTKNMGAETSDEIGDYFAWGETEPKDVFTWANYTLCEGTSSTLKRYNSMANYGQVDNWTQLTLDDDAAYQQWGGLWRMPTKEQAQELKNTCKWELDSSRHGYVLTGPNGNTLFVPISGYIDGTYWSSSAKSCYSWTSTLGGGYPYNSFSLVFEQSSFDKNMPRYCGLTIRPVAM